MGDDVKILIKVKTSQIYCFPLNHITLQSYTERDTTLEHKQ